MPPQKVDIPALSTHSQRTSSSSGPLVGTLIIMILLLVGAFYLWGATLNRRDRENSQLPLIPASDTTTVPAAQ